MILLSLQSGSSGNSIFVEANGVRLLFDAGLSPTQVEQRLAAHGIDPMSIDALIISHNHSDHVRFAGSTSRRFGLPVHITRPTLEASRRAFTPRDCAHIQTFKSGDSLKIGHLTVETVGTPHDAEDGVVFVVDDGRQRLGICTDVGHVFGELESLVRSVDGLFLESNYDPAMLADGHYPRFLKARIAGPGGHLANAEAAELVARHAGSRLQWLCLAHLSGKNNTARKALAAHRSALGAGLPIHVTSRARATEKLQLGGGQLAFDF